MSGAGNGPETHEDLEESNIRLSTELRMLTAETEELHGAVAHKDHLLAAQKEWFRVWITLGRGKLRREPPSTTDVSTTDAPDAGRG